MAQFYITLSESNIDIANNQSDVTAKLYLQTTVAYSGNQKNGSITIDGTTYNFTFNVEKEGVTLTNNMEIFCDNDTSLGSDLEISSDSSLLVNANVGDCDFVYGEYSISDGNETLTFKKTWDVGNFGIGDFSLWAFLKEWEIQDDGGEGSSPIQYVKILVWLVSLASVFTLMYTQTGTDSLDSALHAIIAGIAVTWIFSLAGWLISPAFPTPWLQKHGIATFLTIIGLSSVIWRTVRR